MCDAEYVSELEKRLLALLDAAYRFDDKPHHLFSTIRGIAIDFGTPNEREEIVRLMDQAYARIHDHPELYRSNR